MSAVSSITQGHGQNTKKVIAFGGTGKTVALIYLKIGKLLGEKANIVVCDFPPSSDPNSPDGRLDRDLAAEGIGQQFRINTLPDHLPQVPNSLVETFRLPTPVADALFNVKQQSTPPSQGLNQEPQVGAMVAQLKLHFNGDQIRSLCVSGGEPDIFMVAGLGGGTGTGVTPSMARFLRSQAGNSRLHGVFLLPWQDIGSNQVGNTGQDRNAKSLLKYLGDHGEELFHSVVVIGSPPGVRAYLGGDGTAKRPIHPTLILAALYIHLWHEFGGGAQLSCVQQKMETLRSGIALSEIKGASGNDLHEMLVHSARVERILLEVIDQSPDDRLSLLSLWPLSAPLCWNSIEWLLKKYKQYVKGSSYGSAWSEMRLRLKEIADQERERRRWIVDLAKEPLLFQFNEDQIYGDARTDYDSYRSAVTQNTEHRDFNFKTTESEAALNEVCSFYYQMISRTILATMRLRRQ